MEDYFAAKRRLFDAGPRPAVVNVDDPYGAPARAPSCAERDHGRDRRADADLRATRRRSSTRPASTLRRSDGPRAARRRCPGASTSQRARRASPRRARSASTTRRSPRRCRGAGRVPGRFEPVDEGQAFAVLVDYAHTPDSLENVLRAARELTAGGVHRRVRLRRRPRPRQAPADGRDRRARWPTSSIVTSDNPRSEDPEAIIAEILGGTPAPDVEGDRRPPRGDRARGRARRAPATSSSSPARATSRARSSRTAARCRSTTSTSPGRRCVRDWSPERVAEAAGARLRRAAPRRRRPRRGVVDRLARRRRRATCSSACAATHVDGGRFAPQALAAGAWGVLVGARARGRARCATPGVAARRRRPARRAAARSPRAWRRELGAQVDRRHRLDRQDVDEGPARRDARAAPPRRRHARRTSTPRSGCR